MKRNSISHVDFKANNNKIDGIVNLREQNIFSFLKSELSNNEKVNLELNKNKKSSNKKAQYKNSIEKQRKRNLFTSSPYGFKSTTILNTKSNNNPFKFNEIPIIDFSLEKEVRLESDNLKENQKKIMTETNDGEISGRNNNASNAIINKIYHTNIVSSSQLAKISNLFMNEKINDDNTEKTNEPIITKPNSGLLNKLFTMISGIKSKNVNIKQKDNSQDVVYLESQENLIKNKGNNYKSKLKFKTNNQVNLNNNTEENEKWNQLINEELPLISELKYKRKFNSGIRNLKIINYVYDSLSEEENDEEIVKSTDFRKFSIHPHSSFIYYFNIIITISLFLTFTLFPVYICFQSSLQESHFLNSIGIIIDLVMIIDFVLTFFKGFFKEEEIIFDFREIALEFLTTSFIFNLILAFPFYVLIEAISSQYSILYDPLYSIRSNASVLYFISWGRWMRFIALYKFWGILDSFIYRKIDMEEYGLHAKKIVIAKACLFFFLVFHNLTCLWIYIGKIQRESNNWIEHFNFNNRTRLEIYFASFNFNMATILSVGYGDIFPTSYDERLFICFYMFFATLIYSFIVSWMSSVISEDSRKQIIFNQKKAVLNRIINDYAIGSSLEKQLRKSLSFMEKNYTADIHALLNTLPEKLKGLVYKKIFQRKIGELDFYKETSEEFILYCTPRIELVSLKKSETLISIGDIFTEMYMVNKGNINFYLGAIYNNYRINSIGKGYHFGDVNMYLNEPSEYTIKAASLQNEVFTLKKTLYSELKRNFPDIIESIIKKSIDNFSNLELLRKEACFYYERNGNLDDFRIIINKKLQNNHFNSLQLSEASELINSQSQIDIEKLTGLVDNENKRKFINNPFFIGNQTLMNHKQLAFGNKKTDSKNNSKLSIKEIPIEEESTLVDKKQSKIYNIVIKRDPNLVSGHATFSKKIYEEDAKKGIKKIIKKKGTSKSKRNIKSNEYKIYCYKNYLEDNVASHFRFSNIQENDNREVSNNSEYNKVRNNRDFKSVIKNIKDCYDTDSTWGKKIEYKSPSLFKRKINYNFSAEIPASTLKFNNKTNTRGVNTYNRSSNIIKLKSFGVNENYPLSEIKKRSKKLLNKKETIRLQNIEYPDNTEKIEQYNSEYEIEKNKAKNLNQLENKNRFHELNKSEMMKDFGRRIDKNAFFDNNLDIYEGYLKNFIENKSGAIKGKVERTKINIKKDLSKVIQDQPKKSSFYDNMSIVKNVQSITKKDALHLKDIP